MDLLLAIEDEEVTLDNPPVYEEQDPRVSREIRQKYREAAHELREVQECGGTGSRDLRRILTNANKYVQEVVKPREAASDSGIIVKVSQIGLKQVEDLRDNRAFDALELCQKLADFLGELSEDGESCNISNNGWVRYGKEIRHFFASTPTIHLMNGPIHTGMLPLAPKKRKTKKTTKDTNKPEPAKRPIIVDPRKVKLRAKTTEDVHRMHKHLAEQCPNGEAMCLFEYFFDPSSFGKTIENMFSTAFLIRDGLAEVTLDTDNLPAVRPVPNKKRNERAECKQVVIALTMQDFEDIVNVYELANE